MNSHLPIVSIEKARKGKLLAQPGCSVAIYFSINDVSEDWDEAAPANNIFLQRPYLAALEQKPPKNMRFGYLVFYRDQQPAGVAALQVFPFNADKSIHEKEVNGTDVCFFSAFGRYLKSLVAGKVEFYTLVCGNLLITGEHGFYFNEKLVNEKISYAMLEEGLTFAQESFDKIGFKTDVSFVKDFFPHNSKQARSFLSGYYEFTVQPNMIMPVWEEWKTFDDYLSSLSSKYRVRAKRAFKKAEGLEKVIFTYDQIETYGERLYQLYENVVENAGFNLINLHPNYLLALKEHLGEDFQLTAYFDGDVLAGFCTTIRNGSQLETHFLGYDPAVNKSRQLYLNMLFDMVETGINAGCESVVFARTALEIKSSIGAEPHDMYCYIRHRNNFANRFMKPLLDYLKPDDNWVPRSPFKD